MAIKLDKYITTIKLNNQYIKEVRHNGYVIFRNEDLGIDIKIEINDKNINVSSNTTGFYDLYYANDNGILNDFEKIASLYLKENILKSYEKFNNFNIAPLEATKIILCKNGETSELASSPIPDVLKFDNSKYGNKLYSIGVLSDVHIDGDGYDEAYASADFKRALNFYNNNAEIVCISGDLCIAGGLSELSMFKTLVDNNSTIPVYASRGNHDCYYTLEDWNANVTNGTLYNLMEYNNDIYIYLGMNAYDFGDNCFTTEELDWLETKLEENKNRRTFLFFHVFSPNTCGNVKNLYPYSSLNRSSTKIQRFLNLITNYKNVIYFSGHSHLEFKCQNFGANANIFDDGSMCKRVHTPSCAKPRINSSGSSSSDTSDYYAGSEGYLVDVYENCIVLKGRDFIKGKYLPIAHYLLDTTLIEYEEEPGKEIQIIDKTIYAGSSSSSYWSNTSNAVGYNDSTSSSYGGTRNNTMSITLNNYDISEIPSNANITSIIVSVRHNVNNVSYGNISATCSLGDLTLTETASKHTDETTFSGNYTKDDLSNFNIVYNNNRTSKNTYTTYLYWASIKITYEIEV